MTDIKATPATDEDIRIWRSMLERESQFSILAGMAKMEAELATLRAQVETLREALASIVHPSPDRPAWWSADQAPGHSHEIPGIWDRDNGDKSGKPCEWCATWLKAAALAATEPKE